MLNIFEYINKYKYLHPSYVHNNDEKMTLFLKSFSDSINVIEICSTDIYPQRISIKENDYLVWDHAFWMLYKLFYNTIWTIKVDKSSFSKLKGFIECFTNLYLSLHLNKFPSYSYIYALKYNKSNKYYPDFQWFSSKDSEVSKLAKTDGDISAIARKQYMEFPQMFVFFHEYQHFVYREKENILLEHIDFVQSIFTKFGNAITPLNNNCWENLDKPGDTLHFDIHNASKSFIEELCCDMVSLARCVKVLSKDTEQSIDEIMKIFVYTIRYVVEMQKLFKSASRIVSFRINEYKDIKEKKSKESNKDLEKELIYENDARHSIIIFLACFFLNIDTKIFTDPFDIFKNELFDSDLYTKALTSCMAIYSKGGFDLAAMHTYSERISNNFTPSQLLSARNLLIGWY